MKEQGRPTKRSKHLEKIILNLGREGKTNAQIAKIADVGLSTLNRWLSEDEDFRDSLRASKLEYDTEAVESSLLKRCLGHVVNERKVKKDKDGNILEIIETTKEIPPDPSALALYLRNRMPDVYCEKARLSIETENKADFSHGLTLREIQNGKSIDLELLNLPPCEEK